MEIGAGIAQSLPERLDILNPDNFQSVLALILPRSIMVPNGVRVSGYTQEEPAPMSDRRVEWLLTIPEADVDRA